VQVNQKIKSTKNLGVRLKTNAYRQKPTIKFPDTNTDPIVNSSVSSSSKNTGQNQRQPFDRNLPATQKPSIKVENHSLHLV
jgi:hypothetical protein